MLAVCWVEQENISIEFWRSDFNPAEDRQAAERVEVLWGTDGFEYPINGRVFTYEFIDHDFLGVNNVERNVKPQPDKNKAVED